MKRRIIVSICCLLMLAATPFAARDIQAQTGGGLRLLTELAIPDSNNSKFPHVAVGKGLAHISSNANNRDAYYWVKEAGAVTAIGSPFRVGFAEGKEDYSNTAVTVGPDGSVYYAWSNQANRNVYFRRYNAGTGAWEAQRVVNSGSSFPVSVEIAISSKNEIFVVWRDPNEIGKMRRSADFGTSWFDAVSFSGDLEPYRNAFHIATGPNGLVAVSFIARDGSGLLQAFASLWDPIAQTFDLKRVTNYDSNYADAGVAISRSGTVYVSWRGIETSGGLSGYFYAERQPDGSWARSRLVGGDVVGPTNINANDQNDLSFVWISKTSGSNRVYFAFAPAKQAPVGPIASTTGGAIFDANSAVGLTASKDVLTHVVHESFNGGSLKARYVLFQSTGASFGADPKIEGDAASVGGKTSVQVTFQNPRNLNADISKTQVRWRWNAAPTDAANDSGGWKAYGSTITVPIPPSILSNTSCVASTLYTQLRDIATSTVEEPAKSDAIIVDGVVESSVDVRNPFIDVASIASTPSALAALAAAPTGATGAGDPLYTRVPVVALRVQNLDDCTGLDTVAVGKSANALEATYNATSEGYKGTVALPDLVNIQTGPRPVVVQVKDEAKNTSNSSFVITYDTGKPVFDVAGSGSPVGSTPVSATANPAGNLFQNLTFTKISATDDLYKTGARQFWGVWVANSRTTVSDPVNDPNLVWVPLAAPGTSDSFTIEDWSLASGIAKANLTAGAYHIYVRVLDGAGNPSDDYTSITLNFASAPTAPDMYVPLIRR